MSKMTFSDEEIEELLKEAENEPVLDDDVQIDERTFKYWMKGAEGMPVLSLDFKYGIYMLKKFEYGDRTYHYWVEDSRDNSFSVGLSVFLDMDERGELPAKVDINRGNRKKVRSFFHWGKDKKI